MAARAREVAISAAPRGAPPRAGSPTQVRTPPPKPEGWRGLLSNYGSMLGLTLAAVALFVGWTGRETRPLFADAGLGYALGIVGSLLILTLLLYPLRKRYKILKVLGKVKNWFKTHMILGVVGPIAILYHCNFQLGSLNSAVALFSMLLVAGSGLIGRFLYTKIHHGLYGRRASLKELLSQVKLTTEGAGGAVRFVPNLLTQIADFDREVLKPPQSYWAAFLLPFKLAYKTRIGYFKISRSVHRQLIVAAVNSPVVSQHQSRLQENCNRFIKEHLRRVRRVAEFAAYERLFSLWHKVHLPFFYLLLITAIVHVVAVHWYSL